MDGKAKHTFLGFCDRWLEMLGRGLVVVAMASLAVMTILIVLQVASRNFLNLGLPWADELARLTGLIVVFATIPLLQYQGRHIAVDMLSSRFKGGMGTVSRCINEAAVLIFCVLLLVSFNGFLQRAGHFSTPAMGLPNWLFYAPALTGIACCSLVTALRLLHFCLGKNMANDQDSTSAMEELS